MFSDASSRDKPAWQKRSTPVTATTTPETGLDSRSRFRRMRSRIQSEEVDNTNRMTPLPQTPPVRKKNSQKKKSCNFRSVL